MGLSIMVDHIKPLLRLKSDQQFSHSLCQKRKLTVLEGKLISIESLNVWDMELQKFQSINA